MKKYIAYLLIAFALFNCSEDDAPAEQALGEVQINTIGDVTADTAQITSEVTSDGGATITSRGICWSTTENPTTNDDITSDGDGTGTYTSNLTNLVPNNTYYIRAYVVNATGTAYSEQEEITTNLPEVTTGAITNITTTTIDVDAEVTSEGSSAVSTRGICWSTSPIPTINDSTINNGQGIGVYTSTLTELSAETTYYIRAYATNSIGTTYGNEIEFNSSLPVVSTTEISNITPISAMSGGEVTDEGETAVLARGVCWSTSPNPTVDNDTTTDGVGIGLYTSNITGLTVNTAYYLRSYATNSSGTSYGNEIEFNTNLPSVTVTPITNISDTSAESGGEVTDEGGTSVTAKGICWSTTPNPTITDNITSDGNGLGTFQSNITNLAVNASYYTRAYATNSLGTAYSDEIEFNTNLPTVTTNTITYVSVASSEIEAEVTSEGGSAISERGVCWSTTQNPTIDDNSVSTGSGIGTYTSIMTGLIEDETYYIRAYATNSIGITYGNELQYLNDGCVDNETNNIITLLTQQDVDAFSYSSTGSLIIGDVNNPSNITDLSALSCLKTINGSFRVLNNPNLPSFSGLENLEEIKGEVLIENNNSLTEINLENVITVDRGSVPWGTPPAIFEIKNNPSLVNISIPNAAGYGSIFYIRDNAMLTSIDFQSINSLFTLSISNNPELSNLNFSSLETVVGYDFNNDSPSGTITISDTKLTNVDGFGSITSTYTSSFAIIDNPLLTNLDGFTGGQIRPEYLIITNNNSLISVDGLANVTYPSGYEVYLRVEDNPLLVDLSVLANYFTGPVYGVRIRNNISLTNVDLLSPISYCIYAGIAVTDNSSLTDFCGLTNFANAVIENANEPFPDICDLLPTGNAYNPSAQDIVDGNCSQ